MTSTDTNTPPPIDPELWRDAKLVSKEAARVLVENRHLSWYEALRRARLNLGYIPEVGS